MTKEFYPPLREQKFPVERAPIIAPGASKGKAARRTPPPALLLCVPFGGSGGKRALPLG